MKPTIDQQIDEVIEQIFSDQAGYKPAGFARSAIKQIILDVIGPDSPLEPSPEALRQPGVDPLRWREWSIVENHLRAEQRALLTPPEVK